MGIQVKVNGPRGEEKVIELCQNNEQMKRMTVLELKKKVSDQLMITEEFRIVFRTEQLEESKKLETYGIRHMSNIHTVLMLPGGL